MHREQLDKLAQELEQQGVPFQEIPGSIYPGMKYVTPRDLIDAKVTKYTQAMILKLVRDKEIPAYHLAGKVVLDAEGVQRLLQRERESVAAPNAGRRAGRRFRAVPEDEHAQEAGQEGQDRRQRSAGEPGSEAPPADSSDTT
jgi:hypothetical protein